jgi:hypothetical protein
MMDGELFDSTIPFGEPELLKTSAYRRYLDELDSHPSLVGSGLGRQSQLSTSLLADLARCETQDRDSDAVEVVAACIRHSSEVTLFMQCGERVVPLTVFPHTRLVHCPMDMGEFIERHLSQLRVMNVEAATLRPPGDSERELIGEEHLHHPLTPLLWALALRGPRRELLPEIAGPAVYRVSPTFDVAGLTAGGALNAAIEKLRHQATPLSGIASWPAFTRERAARLLNALYLQAGLIISRSHPDAVRDSWFSAKA